jgi:beta-galactosidase
MRSARSIALAVPAAAPVWLGAQEPAPPIQPQISAERPPWEDLAVLAIGKEPPRTQAPVNFYP